MDLGELIRQLQDNEFSAPLLKYLTSRDALPQITLGTPPAPHQYAGGLYEHGMPWEEPKITVQPTQNQVFGTSIHELTHAADAEMNRQRYFSRGNSQFDDAYDKMIGGFFKPGGQREELARRISPAFMDWSEAKRYYGTGTELGAIGMGETVESGYGAADHIGPTMATEMQILLDLAMRKRK